METIKLIECISNTWQGEGVDVGKRMLLCRFKYCNRHCSWCDTLTKMRAFAETEITIDRLQEIIDEEKVGLMISGGEPTFSNQLIQSISMLNNLTYPVANVETNGLGLLELIKEVDPGKNVHYSYSPKIFNDKEWDDAYELAGKLANNSNVFLKLVISKKDNLMVDYLNSIVNNNQFPSTRIFLMPLGKTKEEMFNNAPYMFDLAEEFKTCVSSRMHLVYDFV